MSDEQFKNIAQELKEIFRWHGKDYCKSCNTEQNYVPNPFYMHSCPICGDVGASGLHHKSSLELAVELLKENFEQKEILK